MISIYDTPCSRRSIDERYQKENELSPRRVSQPIQIPKQIHRRTLSEIQMLQDRAMADYRDHQMFHRIVTGMIHQSQQIQCQDDFNVSSCVPGANSKLVDVNVDDNAGVPILDEESANNKLCSLRNRQEFANKDVEKTKRRGGRSCHHRSSQHQRYQTMMETQKVVEHIIQTRNQEYDEDLPIAWQSGFETDRPSTGSRSRNSTNRYNFSSFAGRKNGCLCQQPTDSQQSYLRDEEEEEEEEDYSLEDSIPFLMDEDL